MNSGSPAIVKAAERLLYELELAVTVFPRKHRYQLGSDMRAEAVEAVLLAQEAFRAAREKSRQAELVGELSRVIDKLKLRVQLARRLQCYSAGRFELIAKIVVDVGKQCGGWKRQIDLHLNGQNPAPARQPERPETLSTRTASIEANR